VLVYLANYFVGPLIERLKNFINSGPENFIACDEKNNVLLFDEKNSNLLFHQV
jgi:hypothetical protein